MNFNPAYKSSDEDEGSSISMEQPKNSAQDHYHSENHRRQALLKFYKSAIYNKNQYQINFDKKRCQIKISRTLSNRSNYSPFDQEIQEQSTLYFSNSNLKSVCLRFKSNVYGCYSYAGFVSLGKRHGGRSPEIIDQEITNLPSFCVLAESTCYVTNQKNYKSSSKWKRNENLKIEKTQKSLKITYEIGIIDEIKCQNGTLENFENLAICILSDSDCIYVTDVEERE